MKLAVIDDRKSELVNVNLKAAVSELVDAYQKYAATKGQRFRSRGQLIAAIVEAFVHTGDKDFSAWRKQAKPTGKVNGVAVEVVTGFEAITEVKTLSRT